jgi:branched-subunit amino acid transport protein
MTSNELILILGMMLVTFLPRYAPMVVVGRLPMPDRLFRALRYVPVAVLTAISVPAALMPEKTINFGISNAYLYAAIASVVIAGRFQNLLYTIGGGMIVFLLWRVVLG